MSVDEQATTGRKRRGGAIAAILGVVVLLAAGGTMIYLGLQPTAPEPAPLPTAFTASPKAQVSVDATAKELPADTLSIPDLAQEQHRCCPVRSSPRTVGEPSTFLAIRPN